MLEKVEEESASFPTLLSPLSMSTAWKQPPPPSILSRRVTTPSDATPRRIYTSNGFLSSMALSTRCFKYQLLKICLPNKRIPYSPLRPLLLTWHVTCTHAHRSPHLYSMRGFPVPCSCRRSANHTATQPSFSRRCGCQWPCPRQHGRRTQQFHRPG